jgi:(+)-trans-carveol dehydrogenase
LAEEGADIIAIDVAGDIERDLGESVKRVRDLGRRIVATTADVRDRGALRAAVEEGVLELGRLDIVVAWQKALDVNLTGVWHTCAISTAHLRSAGGGAIIITSSTAGLKGSPNTAAYTASKHGAVGLMRTLANELARDLIRVNTVHPGTVDTPMLDDPALYRMLLPDHDGEISRQDVAPVWQATNALPIPWVEPVDISNAVLFLASDEARYITGVTLPVDAGFTVK